MNVMVSIPKTNLNSDTDLSSFGYNLPIETFISKEKFKLAHPINISSTDLSDTDNKMNNVITNSPTINTHAKGKKPILNLKSTKKTSNTDTIKIEPVQQLNIFDQNDNVKASKCNKMSSDQNVILLSDEESINDLFSALENISDGEMKNDTDTEKNLNNTVSGTCRSFDSTDIKNATIECITISSDEDEAIITGNENKRSEIFELFADYQIKKEKSVNQIPLFKECFVNLSQKNDPLKNINDIVEKNEVNNKDNKTDTVANNIRTSTDAKNKRNDTDAKNEETDTAALQTTTDAINFITDLNVKNKTTKHTDLNTDTVTSDFIATDATNEPVVTVSKKVDIVDKTTVESIETYTLNEPLASVSEKVDIVDQTTIELIEKTLEKLDQTNTDSVTRKLKKRTRSKSVETIREIMNETNKNESPINSKDLEYLDLNILGDTKFTEDFYLDFPIPLDKLKPVSTKEKIVFLKLRENILDLVPKINQIEECSKKNETNDNNDLLNILTEEPDKNECLETQTKDENDHRLGMQT